MPPPVTWLSACTPPLGLGDEAQQRLRVEAGRLEQRLAPRRAEVGGVVAVLDAGARDDVADERVAVRVQAARGEREHDVAVAHAVGAEDVAGLDDTGRGARDVVVVDAEEARVLGGLAADEGGSGLGAPCGDAADDVGDALGEDLAARDVVGHEERLRADDDDVVDDHADEVEPDGVVLVDGLGDRDLRADAVGARREERLRVRAERGGVEQPGEPADAADHLGTVRAPDRGLHELDREVARGRVDPGGGIGVHGGVARGRSHGSSLPAARLGACAERRTAGPDGVGPGSRMAAWAARALRSG